MRRYFDFERPVVGGAVAFGFFDGVHPGHQRVIKTLAREESPVVVSFYPEKGSFIYTEDEKAAFFEKENISAMYSVPARFGEELSDFFESVLFAIFHAKKVILGDNHEKISDIRELAGIYGMEVVTVPAFCVGDEPLNRERLLEAFAKGSYSEIRDLLGHDLMLKGVVVHGKAIGRKAGLPTANLQLPEGKLLPPLGVYGSRVHIGNRTFKGMTNIGPRPTVDNVIKPTVETFILNFDEDCYGAEMTLDIRHYVRGTRKFADLEEVKRQVDQDIRTIEEIEGE